MSQFFLYLLPLSSGREGNPLSPLLSRRRGEEDNMNPVFSHSHKVLLLPEKLGATFFVPICDALKTFPKHFNPFRTIALFLNHLKTSENLFRGYKNGTFPANIYLFKINTHSKSMTSFWCFYC